MDLRNLKTFHVVSIYLNFTKAAEVLNYSQPTISQQIKVLEDEIGHALFNRVGKKMFLSQVGQLLKRHTETIFSVMEELEHDLKKFEKPYGNLTIAAPEFYSSYYIAHFLGPFIKQHPQVNLKLHCSNSRETLRLVSSNKADIGFIAGKQNQPGIEEILIDEEDLVLVANPAITRDRSFHEILEDSTFITYGIDEIIKGCLREIGCIPRTVVECGSEEAIKQAVISRAGIALLSELIIKDEVERESLTVLYRFPKRLPTYIIYPENLKGTSTVTAFIDLVMEKWTIV